jgi:hypothetical protein
LFHNKKSFQFTLIDTGDYWYVILEIFLWELPIATQISLSHALAHAMQLILALAIRVALQFRNSPVTWPESESELFYGWQTASLSYDKIVHILV